MSNLSNDIEKFLLSVLADNGKVQISRNDLAGYFKVAPSQINYVLQTRFTLERGYVIESKRGGGGYVNLVKVSFEGDYFKNLLQMISEGELNENKAFHIIDKMNSDGVLSDYESGLLKSVLSDKSLSSPFKNQDLIRKNSMTEIIKYLMSAKSRQNDDNAEKR